MYFIPRFYFGALNPQPLPPRYTPIMLNPQPLPPRYIVLPR